MYSITVLNIIFICPHLFPTGPKLPNKYGPGGVGKVQGKDKKPVLSEPIAKGFFLGKLDPVSRYFKKKFNRGA